jgi:hypothetical protein
VREGGGEDGRGRPTPTLPVREGVEDGRGQKRRQEEARVLERRQEK